jgi:hypothetical protein
MVTLVRIIFEWIRLTDGKYYLLDLIKKGATYHVPDYVFGVSGFGFSPFLIRLKALVDRVVNP